MGSRTRRGMKDIMYQGRNSERYKSSNKRAALTRLTFDSAQNRISWHSKESSISFNWPLSIQKQPFDLSRKHSFRIDIRHQLCQEIHPITLYHSCYTHITLLLLPTSIHSPIPCFLTIDCMYLIAIQSMEALVVGGA